MSKLKFWLPSLLLMAAGMFSSCTDRDDNSVNPPEPVIDPLTDTYIHEAEMDKTVNPGDSFYDFATGTWTLSHAADDLGTNGNVAEALKKMGYKAFMASSDPQVLHLLRHLQDPGTKEQQDAFLNRLMGAFYAADGKTYDILKGLGRMADYGEGILLKRVVVSQNDILVNVLTAGNMNTLSQRFFSAGEGSKYKEAVKEHLRKYITDPDVLEKVAADIAELEALVYECQNSQYSGLMDERRLTVCTPVERPDRLFKTRSAGMTDHDLQTAYKIDPSRDVLDSKARPLFDKIAQTDPRSLFYYSLAYLTLNHSILMPRGTDADVASDKWRREVYDLLTKKVPVFLAPIDRDVLAPLCHEQECLDEIERIRTLLGERISQLEWMSEATKQEALAKLAKMKFHAGVFDNLVGEGAFELTGATLYEDYLQLQQQNVQLRQRLVGKSYKKHFLEYVQFDFTLTSTNAFYEPEVNGLYILPAFCMLPFFPGGNQLTDGELATRYATMVVFAHEMCHGFDSMGSQYDGDGNLRDWWTADDKQAFHRKQQQMIDLFSQLEAYPGQPADGKKTLGENMADMGGVRLAIELYRQTMQDRGYEGEALKHQLREFLLHYAHLWKSPKADLARLRTLYLRDVHSAYFNRVNGQVRLIDEWYDLFGIKPGTKLYLPPEQRPHIW